LVNNTFKDPVISQGNGVTAAKALLLTEAAVNENATAII
jgi:hypothetical protein